MSDLSAGHGAIQLSGKLLGSLKGSNECRQNRHGGATYADPAFNAKADEQAALMSADHAGLLTMLAETVRAQWQYMVDKTVDLGRGFLRIEAILTRASQKFGDTRAAAALAYINEIEDTPDKLFKPCAKNYAPRGLPCVLKVSELFGIPVPLEKLEAVRASVAHQQGVQADWDSGRAAMGAWMRQTVS